MRALKTKNQWRWAYVSNIFLKSTEWRTVRKIVLEKLGNRCCKCGSTTNLHCDHVIPRVRDQKCEYWLDLNNLQILCKDCNEEKSFGETDFRTKFQKQILSEAQKEAVEILLKKNLRTEWTISGDDKPYRLPKFARSQVKDIFSLISHMRTVLIKKHEILSLDKMNKISEHIKDIITLIQTEE